MHHIMIIKDISTDSLLNDYHTLLSLALTISIKTCSSLTISIYIEFLTLKVYVFDGQVYSYLKYIQPIERHPNIYLVVSIVLDIINYVYVAFHWC